MPVTSNQNYAISQEELLSALGDANRQVLELQAKLDQYKWLDDALRKRTVELSERVKELQCLHSATTCLHHTFSSEGEMYQTLIRIVTQGWQYPEWTSARLVLNKSVYSTPVIYDTPFKQVARIHTFGRTVGHIEIHVNADYIRRQRAKPFLDEEQNLLNTLAIWIGTSLEKHHPGWASLK